MGIKPKGLTETQLIAAGIGQDYWECDFDKYDGPMEAMLVAVKYLRSLDQVKSEGVGLLFGGPPGPGKTTLALIMAKYLIRSRWNVYCTSLGEIVEAIKKGWEEGEESNDLLHSCRSADFLFIDDLGKEHRGATGFVQTVFDNLIRFRIQHRLPTFITTNLTKAEIERTYGDSVISLLEGKLFPVVVNGKDYRRTELKQNVKALLK